MVAGVAVSSWSNAAWLPVGLLVFGLLMLFDLVVRRISARRIDWIDQVGYELRRIARDERSSAELREPPDDAMGPLHARFSEVAASIIQQRKSVEQQRSTLEEILNGMGEGLLAIDESKRIVLANERVAELFGLKRLPSGRPFYEILRNKGLAEALDHGLAGEVYRQRTSVAIGVQDRQLEIRVVPVLGDSEIAAVAVVIDMTQIEVLGRIRQDFIADFSHEVRTPLAGLRSSVETLHGGRLEPGQEEQLHRIVQRQLGRLERLVSDLAELNSIESGETVLHKEPTDLRHLLADLAHDFLERHHDPSVSIVVMGDDSIADVDPVRIEQVFSNLIDNAIRHAPGSDEICIEVRDSDDMAEVRVTDHGPGIPGPEQEKVFRRFYRVDKSRSGEVAGTGLGLAITKHLVIQHGGSVAVDSEVGRGATFIVRLPKAGS